VLIEGRNFINKVWNASRFVIMNLEGYADDPLENPSFADKWIISRLSQTVQNVTDAFEAFDFAKATRAIYDFFWTDFCDWYVEMAKVPIFAGGSAKSRTQRVLRLVLDNTLRLLHPIAPFVTEEIWQMLPHQGESIMISAWPIVSDFASDINSIHEMEIIQESVKSIRNLKASLRVHQAVVPCSFNASGKDKEVLERETDFVTRLARIENFAFAPSQPSGTVVAISGERKFYLDLSGRIDIEAESARVKSSIEKANAEMAKLDGLLGNEDFIKRAKPEVIEKNQARKTELVSELEGLAELLKSLGV
jgi:valyl-tRNA synthetase